MTFKEQVERLTVQVQDLEKGLIATRDATRKDFSEMRNALDRIETRFTEQDVKVLTWLQQVIDTVRTGEIEQDARFTSLETRMDAVERLQAG